MVITGFVYEGYHGHGHVIPCLAMEMHSQTLFGILVRAATCPCPITVNRIESQARVSIF